jgi:hypothetical protein
MPSERWQQLEQLFAEAVALPVDRREAFVEGASSVDPGLRDELTALLATVEHAGPFLSSTASTSSRVDLARAGVCGPATRSGPARSSAGSAPAARGSGRPRRADRTDVAIKLLLPHPGNGTGRLPRCTTKRGPPALSITPTS